MSNEIATTESSNMLFNPDAFEHAQRVAKLFAASQLVPQHLQGRPSDVFIGMHIAHRLREDPLMVLQNITVIHGTAGWKATWMIARANRSGFSTPIRYRTEGDGEPIPFKRRVKESGSVKYVDATVPNITVTAYAKLRGSEEEVSFPVSMQTAIDEGWAHNPKYSSIGQLMLSYRAASFLVRLHCPEVLLGFQTAEELEDMAAAGKVIESKPSASEGLAALTQDAEKEQLEGVMGTSGMAWGEEEGDSAPGNDEPEEGPGTPDQDPEKADSQDSQETSPETGSTHEGEEKSPDAPLYGSEGALLGSYKKAGSYLNAIQRLLEGAETDEGRQNIWHHNRSVLERIGRMDRYKLRVEELESTVPSGESEEPESDPHQGKDPASDSQIFNACVEGLDELKSEGNVEEIRARVEKAKEIGSDKMREWILEQLDEALEVAQGGEE